MKTHIAALMFGVALGMTICRGGWIRFGLACLTGAVISLAWRIGKDWRSYKAEKEANAAKALCDGGFIVTNDREIIPTTGSLPEWSDELALLLDRGYTIKMSK